MIIGCHVKISSSIAITPTVYRFRVEGEGVGDMNWSGSISINYICICDYTDVYFEVRVKAYTI